MLDRVLRRIGPPVGDMTHEQLQQLRQWESPDTALANLVFGEPARQIEVVERGIDDHDWPIPLRIYRPRGATGLPVLVFFHGGGWVIGNVAQSTWMCGQIAHRVGAVVVSAGYRLAPEHRFPAAVEDTYAGLCWISAHADERITYLNHYTQGTADPSDPRLSPLRAASVADLPPALVITAEHDPLRDEARRYAQRLRAEGTPARYTDYVGMAHGFMSFPGLASGARQALAEMCQELADAFGM